MTWYYLSGSQPTGPVDDPEIDRLFNHGTITLGTRVWRQGLQTWKTFAEAFNLPAVDCFKCKRLSSPDLSVRYGGLSLCQDFKEIFFQQIREGLSPDTSGIYGGFFFPGRPVLIAPNLAFSTPPPLFLAFCGVVFLALLST